MKTYIATVGKTRCILKQCDNQDDALTFLTQINKGSEHLKVHNFGSFECDDTLEDGLYVIKQDSMIRVYKLESLTLDGYLYSSTYKTRKVVTSYELIKGDSDLI